MPLLGNSKVLAVRMLEKTCGRERHGRLIPKFQETAATLLHLFKKSGIFVKSNHVNFNIMQSSKIKYILLASTLSILCSCAQREDYQPFRFLWQEKASVVLSAPNEFWGETGAIVIQNKSGQNEEISFTTTQDSNNILIEFAPPVPDTRDLTWVTEGDRQKGSGVAVASIKTKSQKFEISFFYEFSSLEWPYLADPSGILARIETGGKSFFNRDGVFVVELQ